MSKENISKESKNNQTANGIGVVSSSLLASIKKELIKIASEIATKKGMPFDNEEDYDLPKSITNKLKRKIIGQALFADKTCNDWAYRIRHITNKIRS